MIDGVDQEIGPSLIAKKVAAPPRAGRDHVSLLRVGRMLPCRSQVRTSGAKAPSFLRCTARLKARPFKAKSRRYFQEPIAEVIFKVNLRRYFQAKFPTLFQSQFPTYLGPTKLTATADD